MTIKFEDFMRDLKTSEVIFIFYMGMLLGASVILVILDLSDYTYRDGAIDYHNNKLVIETNYDTKINYKLIKK